MSNPIERHAPAVASAMAAVGAARAALDIDLEDPRVENFADQFGVDVSVIDDDLRRRFLEATGPTAFEVTQAIYVDDYAPRIVSVSPVRPTRSPALWASSERLVMLMRSFAC